MSDYDRRDFTARVQEKARQRNAQQVPGLQMIQAAGAVMAKLTTQSDEWNRYLSYLQGQIDKTRVAKEAAQAKMNDPAIWDAQHLAKLKSDIREADAMIFAWDLAMKLPKFLIEGGAEATEFLNKLEARDDKAAGSAQS